MQNLWYGLCRYERRKGVSGLNVMNRNTGVSRRSTTGQHAQIDFAAEMLALYDRCASLGFRAVLLRRSVLLSGAVAAARMLLQQPGLTGLQTLQKHGLSEFSMEALMLRPEFQVLFTPEERKQAESLLACAAPSRSRGRLQAAATVPARHGC